MSADKEIPGDSTALADTELLSDDGGLSATTPLGARRGANLSERDADQLKGISLHHFRVEDAIGQGGMGSVYRGYDISLQRAVALKVLPRDFARERPELVERFKREARSQARLSHPNVVPIYYIGEEEGLHFFAMELVEGESLADTLERGETLTATQAVDYMIQIASALEQARRRDLIHRDLKPANLLVTPDGTVKVADFGLAKPLDEGGVELTQEGSFMGTPLYIAPEQARGDEVDHRADMYALGATFFHLLTGRPVFEAPTPMGLAIKHVSEKAPDINDLRDDLPPRLTGVLQRLLSKDEDQRYGEYGELLDELDLIRQGANPPGGTFARSLAVAVDLALLSPTVCISGWLFLAAYPIYHLVCWNRFGTTLGKKLFHLKVRNADGSELSGADTIKRFATAHWGFIAFAIIATATALSGISEISIDGSEDPIELILVLGTAGLLWMVFVTWILGFFYAAIEPGKRSVYDLLIDSRVEYDHH